ncbi:hypothetical protein [uncultured Duncaniella sp.]|uniref:hypothetical protein n=1 Tax=uncultured Duncaniella sp. TaxID=2768039 RepID=UPI0025A94F73|nr:hypothetical protein [uncultured Duncaniella sp.]
MEYIKKIIVGLESRQEANDVADHQNDLGRTSKDRRVIFAGEGDKSKTVVPGWAPLIFIAIATTEPAIKEIAEEFFGEVPVLFEVEDVKENA